MPPSSRARSESSPHAPSAAAQAPRAAEAASERARARGIPFLAPDITTAIEEVRTKLGPDAVILNVRRLPARGLSRLWQKPTIEVLACLPEEDDLPDDELPESLDLQDSPEPAQPTPELSGAPHHHAFLRYTRHAPPTAPKDLPDAEAAYQAPPNAAPPASFSVPFPAPPIPAAPPPEPSPHDGWQCAAILERLGLTPVHVERVLDRMQDLHGTHRRPPEALAQQFDLLKRALASLWRVPPSPTTTSFPLHVVIGPHGTGKSTVLCKLLAKNVLVDNSPAKVWRLDARSANTSEIVSIFGEILGVPVERNWEGAPELDSPGFIDLPGVDSHDADAMQLIGDTLLRLPDARVHLVLNAAYTVPVLLAQARAFSGLPITDLVLTHLDEEPAWGKLWNLVLGTDFPIGYLSTGQNIPGGFRTAAPELLGAARFSP